MTVYLLHQEKFPPKKQQSAGYDLLQHSALFGMAGEPRQQLHCVMLSSSCNLEKIFTKKQQSTGYCRASRTGVFGKGCTLKTTKYS